MTVTITVGRRLIALEQVVLVEPFDPAANSRIQTDRPFKSRIVLLDRESVLAEIEPEEFARQNDFRWIIADQIAANPSVPFGVEMFQSMETFNPAKPYLSRLLWRDGSGNAQSKLLLSEPEALLAIAVRGQKIVADDESHSPGSPPQRGRRPRARSRTPAPAPEQN